MWKKAVSGILLVFEVRSYVWWRWWFAMWEGWQVNLKRSGRMKCSVEMKYQLDSSSYFVLIRKCILRTWKQLKFKVDESLQTNSCFGVSGLQIVGKLIISLVENYILNGWLKKNFINFSCKKHHRMEFWNQLIRFLMI